MSHLAQEIKRQMVAKNLTQSAVESSTGIPQSAISAWLNGRRKTISPRQVRLLARCLCGNDPAAFYRAHLRDIGEQLDPSAAMFLTDGPDVEVYHTAPRSRTKLEDALDVMKLAAIKNSDLERSFIEMAAFLERKGKPVPAQRPAKN